MAFVEEVPGVTVTIQRRLAVVTFRRSDGQQFVAPWPTDRFEDSSTIAEMTYEVGGSLLSFVTEQGDKVVAELPHMDNVAPIAGRPVIYLDQNHMSTMAWSIYRPDDVAPEERRAAERITELEREGRIILPMSEAHLGETCQWRNNDLRYKLALTILQLSRGWQMRDPLSLRNYELRHALVSSTGGDRLVPVLPFTLEPSAIHDSRSRGYAAKKDLPREMAFAVAALASTSSIFDVMLDTEPVAPLPIPAWAQYLQRFTDWLAEEARDPHQRRERTRMVFLRDLLHELDAASTQIGLDTTQLGEWIAECSDEVVATMPSLGIYRELMHEKLLNPGTAWKQSDLVDMMYLSCATAYADHVVAERHLTGHLRAALRRLGRPVNVHRRLCDLVPLLEELR